jgi:hypothetical protein
MTHNGSQYPVGAALAILDQLDQLDLQAVQVHKEFRVSLDHKDQRVIKEIADPLGQQVQQVRSQVQVAQVAQVVPDYRETQGQVVLWGQVDLVVLVDLVELRAPTD